MKEKSADCVDCVASTNSQHMASVQGTYLIVLNIDRRVQIFSFLSKVTWVDSPVLHNLNFICTRRINSSARASSIDRLNMASKHVNIIMNHGKCSYFIHKHTVRIIYSRRMSRD